MRHYFPAATYEDLRTIARDPSEALQRRVAAMALVKEFEVEFKITFGVDKKIE